MPVPLRIIYSAGPGDVIRTYEHWVQGEDDPSQLSVTYSGMFYDFCRQNDADAYVISCCERTDAVRDGRFQIVHRKTPFSQGPGPLFHVGHEWAALRLIASAIWFRADLAVVACGTVSWVALQILPWIGVRVVPSLHCVLWPPYRPPTKLQLILRRLRAPFFKNSASTILSASKEITDQLEVMTDGRHRPVNQFLPSYRKAQFELFSAPSNNRANDFRVLFAGRIERNKGVFDLLEIARRFDAAGEKQISFDLCGNGSALAQLRQAADDAGLSASFRCHGHCDRVEMRAKFEGTHVVVVPTTGDFVEGFNQVVAEAVLAGRPVVTSDVCPALTYVQDAVVEVPVDDVNAYASAILKLQRDSAFYEAKRTACIAAQSQFYDITRSWGHALQLAVNELQFNRDDRRPVASATLQQAR